MQSQKWVLSDRALEPGPKLFSNSSLTCDRPISKQAQLGNWTSIFFQMNDRVSFRQLDYFSVEANFKL